MESAKIIKGNVRPSEVLRIWAFRKQDGTHGTVNIAKLSREQQLFELLGSEENNVSGWTFDERAMGFSDIRMSILEAKNKKEKGIEEDQEFENIEGIEQVVETKVFSSWEPTEEEKKAQRYLDWHLRQICKEQNGPLLYAKQDKITEFGNKLKYVLQFTKYTEDMQHLKNRLIERRDGYDKSIDKVKQHMEMTDEERQQNLEEFTYKIRSLKSKKKRNELT